MQRYGNSQRHEFDRDDDSAEAMAEKFRTFQRRQELAAARHHEDPEPAAADPLQKHLSAVSTTPPNDTWKEAWLFPVDAWSLILALDLPCWETGWRTRSEGGPDPALLLQELERLRGLGILATNEHGQIRRDDAVKVAYRLGYYIAPGTPGFDILLHVHAIVPDSPTAEAQPASNPDMAVIQAATAALIFFPDIAATAGEADVSPRILHTILEKQILPPKHCETPQARERALATIREMLEIVRNSLVPSPP